MTTIPTSYSKALELFEERKRRGILGRGVKLANNTYLDWPSDTTCETSWFAVKLHQTNVITFHSNGRVVLDSGGWKTVTTKNRMNRALPIGWKVGSDKGVWYLWNPGPGWQWDDCPTWAYEDGITIYTDGTVTGEGEDPKDQAKLRNRAKAYAKAYVKALYAGEIPSPSGGDCWGCALVPTDGKPSPHAGLAGPDHMLSHLDEKYYVPSLVLRALDRFGGSQAAQHDVACLLWPDQAPRREDGSLSMFGRMEDQVLRIVRRHVFEQLGLGA